MQSKPDPAARLQTFEIYDLFGEFDYTIPLNVADHVTAIIAPNGSGKTLCLRMIEALFGRRWSMFNDIAFSRAVYSFTNGTVLTLRKTEKDAKASISIIIKPGRGKPSSWEPPPANAKNIMRLERYLPFLTRIAPDRWRHDHTGQLLSVEEVLDAYREHVPQAVAKEMFGAIPPDMHVLLENVDCRLIETQRLLILSDQPSDSWGQRRKTSTLAITSKAEKLKEIISREINAYAALSQSLDRSFPRRVINQANRADPSGLVPLLANLDNKRKELMAAGILDTEADEQMQLPPGDIDASVASVLQVYAQDTQEKLGSLSPLLAKIKLFSSLIERRFLTKDVRVSRKAGIEVFSSGSEVPLEKLSSGEQHQLVLFFEMLFEIKENSLILIDEPELSLHVAWQRQFIGDLLKIIKLNKFDVVLATHSPQLIGEWEDLVVELGDVEETWAEEFGGDEI